MSKNISNLSGRVGLKNNLFKKISDHSLNSTNPKDIKKIACTGVQRISVGEITHNAPSINFRLEI